MKQLLSLLLCLSTFAIDVTRTEVERFHILNDRKHVEKNLLQDNDYYFWTDFEVSSRLFKLIGEIQDTESSSTEVAQTVEIGKLLSQNANTEKYVNLGFDLLIPTIPFAYSKYLFYPMLFYRMQIGTSFSINNVEDALDPSAQVYLMQRTNIGVRIDLRNKNSNSHFYTLELYSDSIKDFFESKTSSGIAAEDDIVNLDELELAEKSIKTNIAYKKKKSSYQYIIEIRDLKIKSSGSSEKESVFGSTPLIHFSYTKILDWSDKYNFKWTFGSHYRSSKYSIAKTFYTHFHMDFKDINPLILQTKIDNQFLGLWMGTRFKKFTLNYGLKMAYRNPQGNIWTPTMHKITFGIPF